MNVLHTVSRVLQCYILCVTCKCVCTLLSHITCNMQMSAAGLSKVPGCSCAEVAAAFRLVEVGTVVSNVPHGTSGVEVRDDAHDGVDAVQGRPT